MVKPSREQTLTPGIILEIFSDKGQDKSLVSSNYSDITLDATLNFISKILMEEDVEEKVSLFYEDSAVRAMEKPFYDLLDKNYPNTVNKSETLEPPHASSSSVVHKFSLQPGSGNLVSTPASEFNKGVEEGMKFLPSMDKLIANFTANNLAVASTCEQNDDLVRIDSDGEVEEKNETFKRSASRGKKKSNVDNLDHLEGRNRKVSMLCSEETARRNALFDEVLLQRDNYMQEVSKLREVVQREAKIFSENDQGEVDDIKNLLIQCSDAVYTNDHELANKLIKQIRKRSSLDGDGIQRMAFLFADALEARLMGTGDEAWRRMYRKRITSSEYAKMVQLYISVCPFPRVSMCCSNRTILNAAEKTSVLHIVSFGIGLGFQWPSLIQALSNPNRKTIKLRITGIDFPHPGFRPAELVEETGRRLEDYARSFNVPFEYRGIAKNWEAISLDDLKIKKDEVLIVNCLYRFRDVGDEAVSLDSPRDRVLNLIYQIRPHIFIEGVLNIRSLSPFFITRFRLSLTLYLALFEIFDLLIPRDNKQRQIIEREILGRDILNVIACEGSDWTMKPESYKQWHQRNLRAGFEQVPLDPAIVKECGEYYSKVYKNKIFFIEEEGMWLLQGWSGRAFYALSTWKPKLA